MIPSLQINSNAALMEKMEEENVVLSTVADGFLQESSSYLHLSFRGISTVVFQRTTVLIMLLLFQSLSQFILEMYEELISHHVIIPMFLTMLVGAGGNAGNQSTVRCITGLATREFRQEDYLLVLRKEIACGLISSSLLTLVGFARVYYFYGAQFYSTIAVSLSLFCIIVISTLLGTTLPFFFKFVGIRKEHAAPCIQVLMDITGVFITCFLCSHTIPKSEGRADSLNTGKKSA
ncbi:putative Mg transporter [Trypanosoma theileri]|uniref:Putative Mg transporter n=1 Tax=Trypanosoma theileri TaxID=67003 RepID=A0A1X0NUQ1_9TRYP|nr:putative Mg transporter [Trypanosoma theileri]ORC88437.1 putative Mg transporter [Trypanosoma theileri]